MQNLPKLKNTPALIEGAKAEKRYDPDEDFELGILLKQDNFPAEAKLSDTPAIRLAEMVHLHGDLAAQQQLDKYLIRFQCLGISVDQMAKQLDISVSATRKLLKNFRDRQKRQIDRLDVSNIIADSMGAFDVAKQEVFKILMSPTSEQVTTKNKLTAASTIGQLETQKMKVLDVNRFYESKGFKPLQDETFGPTKSMNYINNAIQVFINGGELCDTQLFKETTLDIDAEVI
jgi:hypothetical protein